MVDEVCVDTEDDILGIILDEVREMRTSIEGRLELLEAGFDIMGRNIDALVAGYQDHGLRLTQGPPTPLAVLKGGKGDTDA